jgi:hypothetical protein
MEQLTPAWEPPESDWDQEREDPVGDDLARDSLAAGERIHFDIDIAPGSTR